MDVEHRSRPGIAEHWVNSICDAYVRSHLLYGYGIAAPGHEIPGRNLRVGSDECQTPSSRIPPGMRQSELSCCVDNDDGSSETDGRLVGRCLWAEVAEAVPIEHPKQNEIWASGDSS